MLKALLISIFITWTAELSVSDLIILQCFYLFKNYYFDVPYFKEAIGYNNASLNTKIKNIKKLTSFGVTHHERIEFLAGFDEYWLYTML